MKIEPSVSDLSKIRITCEDCHLSRLCLPDGLTSGDQAKIENLIKHRHTIRRGDYLFRSGADFSALYSIRSGSFKLFTYTSDGDEQILGFYFPGDIIGFDAVHKQRYASSALALEISSYCVWPFNRLEELGLSIPSLQRRMLEFMSKEIAHEHDHMNLLCNKTAEEKVGTFLLALSTRFSRTGYSPTSFKLAMSRQDIGNYLGLSVETISRIMGRFQKDKLITINNKSVELLNPELLTRASNQCSAHRNAATGQG